MIQNKGNIGVTTENIFPIIKKFLYSDHEIFLRELISNAVDATQKLKTFAISGEFKGDTDDLKVNVILDKDNKTITIRDNGIGMTADEVEKYINQIAFSGAGDFLDKYKDTANVIIGHFGLGFYSSFMVSSKVEIITKSYKENAVPVKWECDGTPNYSLIETEKTEIGTDVILYIDEESEEFLDKFKLEGLLTKYCKFLPIPIIIGKKTKWEDGKEVVTDEDNQINDVNPLWKQKPVDLTSEQYESFYRTLYPGNFEKSLFNIHLNVDYPFNLTGILYFPKITSNLDIHKNKIQLYCNQVFVTDSVEGIVPEFLTLLHGVLDSPDIPLNVSRSYLQSDSNVKKISSHITKKVADKLFEIFKENREDFEKKWDDLKLFIIYGMISDEKFYEKAEKFFLLKNVDNQYYTLEDYKTKIETNQTDKDKKLIYLYASNRDEQYSYIRAAKNKGYDVILFDGQLDLHFVNTIERKFENTQFVRVDSDIVDNLIKKDNKIESVLSEKEQENLRNAFQGALQDNSKFWVICDNMSPNDMPIIIARDEFMRRMKDMASMGGEMYFYKDMPDNYKVILNTNHKLILDISSKLEKKTSTKRMELDQQMDELSSKKAELENKLKEYKTEEEKPITEKTTLEDIENQIHELGHKIEDTNKDFGKNNKVVSQLIDLALLANNLLQGEALSNFINRSVDILNK
ncbi:MAG: molecular chaperone HtpG [Bacteroidales bacterium]|jgi:molecular chaperone HtpG|nr:molecular chaperone HtpG [Bacteroidales bacterium]